MGRVGLFDRELIHDNGTFVAMNLGYNAVAQHEGAIATYAQGFTHAQEFEARYDKRKKESLWVNTEAYQNGLILPAYTPCALGMIKVVEEENRNFKLLREGYYYVLSIGWHGDIGSDRTIWEKRMQNLTGKTEDYFLDAESYCNGMLSQFAMMQERKALRDVPFAATWGGNARDSIYLYVNSYNWSPSERVVKSIKHCVEQGNMMIEPNIQKVFPNARGGLVLVNMKKLDYLNKRNKK